ncbi:DUF4376 domain-containing protein [Bosea minatitlanensis]|uniref:DUF4376 domain-containing protein n=1 Tax=Bosea minatitlanensis TaxID=128782 RepID=A0ABW0EYD8_9HYPH|nr:DUF4376 domain-containing protein [Bosea minatitlanensis]MCT4491813.1 DUF4376 domain-containing protein [Bosea minatitlanensis]
MMQRFARIDDGVVVEVIELPDTVSVADPENEGQSIERPLALADAFHADLVAAIVPAPTEVETGWSFSDGEFSPPPPPALPTVAELLAYAADLRWRVEQGGAVWNGWPIHTDDRSQGKYLSELLAISLGVRVDNDPWKFADDVFRPVSNADFQDLAIAAREHVRIAFAIEGSVQVQIEAGTITTTEQIDTAFA